MRFTYLANEKSYSVDLDRTADGYRVTVNGQTYEVQVVRAENGEYAFLVGDRPFAGLVAADGTGRWVFAGGRNWVLTAPTAAAGRRIERSGSSHAGAGDRSIVAPMPGQIRAVQVEEGAQVERGQTLFLLEAMKMEIRVQAPRPGRIARLLAITGQTVERDQLLAELED